METPSLKKNFTYSLLYQFLILILPLITLPYISRIFGSENIGIYTYTQTIANFFLLFAMLGILTHGTRAIAAARDNSESLSKTFKELFILKLFFSLTLTILFILFSLFLAKDYKSIFLLQSFYVMSSIVNVNWFCFGMENFRLTTIRDTLVQIVSTTAIFIFVRSSEDLWIYTLILSSAQLISALLVWPYVLKHTSRTKVDPESMLTHLKPLLILFIPILAESIYLIMDKVMLGNMTTAEELGYYECAVRIIVVPGVIIGALNNTAMPRMANFLSNKKSRDSEDLMDKMMVFCTMLGCGMAFGMAAVGQEFAVIFYGDAFTRTGLFLVLLSPAIILKCLSLTVRMQYIIPSGNDDLYVISIVSGAVLNLILNFILIPGMQGVGAIIATLAAEFTAFLLEFVLCRRSIRSGRYLTDLLVFSIFGTAMYFLVRAIAHLAGGGIAGLALQVIGGAAAYILISAIFIQKRLHLIR